MKIILSIFVLFFAGLAMFNKAQYRLWRNNYDILLNEYKSSPQVTYWAKSGKTPDGCEVWYNWKEIEGDTCCLSYTINREIKSQ